MRVVSLLPSATEICFAIGVEPVAVSHECDYPPRASELPSVNRSRVSNAGSSASVNAEVAAAEGEDGVYEIDPSALAAAEPDLVIAQDVCDVCAIDGGLAREALDAVGSDAEVLTLHSHSLDGVLGDIERVGEATGRGVEAESLVSTLRERVEAVETAAANVDDRPRVAVLDWMDPVMVAGHWVPELVELAGGMYGMAGAGDRSTPREWTDVLEYDPEVLVAAPCGFGLERTLEHGGELTGRDGWTELSAVQSNRVYAMDGHHYVNRPGPRLVETLEYLAGLVQPEVFEAPPEDAVRSLARKRSV